ncbi:hypothetical protein E308F_11100 [Moorella sp. E308F]|uniref:hypothetical protein n=1 Tax=Moorella sp. E308F TaxID=2572682 RepID=UPI0010FFB0A9|nr:hypothetical protein [Moorella sp. E308F]GEA14866.1 hypothetical protein E308F_11100 [Moorella sp. E308F]
MIGKVNDDFFRQAILPHTGAGAPEVVVGPRMGVDAAVLKIGEECLAVAEDPIFTGATMFPEIVAKVKALAAKVEELG